MEVTSIELEDGVPVSVVTRMTVSEAACVAKVFGKIAPPTGETSAIYGGLVYPLFDAFWENGMDEVATSIDGHLPHFRLDGRPPADG